MSTTERQIDEKCIFCRIANNISNESQLLYEDQNYVIIKDIRPAVEHHYLLITKNHIKSGKQLKSSEDIEMIKRMKEIGLDFMSSKGLNDDREMRMGFHWPPFNSISHLHLHILYPISRMSFISRMVFRSGSFWFVEINDLIEWLSKK